MSHHGLFIKLMDRNIPVNLLSLLENWFFSGVTCVKWGSVVSRLLNYHAGFGREEYSRPIYLRFISTALHVKKVSDSKIGRYIKGICMSILLYADDILLVAPSVTALQRLLLMCEQELMWLDVVECEKISMHTFWSPI